MNKRCNLKIELKKDIFKKVKQYYQLVHNTPKEKFVPGKTRINYAGRIFDEEEMLNLVDSSLDFWLTYGSYSKHFEQDLSRYLGTQHAFLVNSGSSANLLAFMALTSPLLKERQVKRKDEIITVAAGFPTTVTPIVQYGAVPVFVDIDLATANIDINKMQGAISNKTKAVMIAHTLGNPFDVKKVSEFCKKHNLWLIEDNCDALGAKVEGKFTGTWGDIGTSSFYPPHHMTMGEGGAVYTNNQILKKIMLSIRDWGRDCWCESGKDNSCGKRFCQEFGSLPKGYDHKYVYSHFGYNLKATDMQAAIGCAQLKKLDYFTQKRIEHFKILHKGLDKLKDCLLLPKSVDNAEPSWFGYLITLKDGVSFNRNAIVEYLENREIQTRNLFSGNITRQPMFQHLKKDVDYRIYDDLKNTDKIMNDSFWVGVYPGMSKDALDYIVTSISEFVEKQI